MKEVGAAEGDARLPGGARALLLDAQVGPLSAYGDGVLKVG